MYTSASNGLQTACEQLANQMHVCVNATANLRCAILEICRFLCEHKKNWLRRVSFPCTGCPFHALSVLYSSQVREKLINRALLTQCTRTAQSVSGALVCTKLNELGNCEKHITVELRRKCEELCTYGFG